LSLIKLASLDWYWPCRFWKFNWFRQIYFIFYFIFCVQYLLDKTSSVHEHDKNETTCRTKYYYLLFTTTIESLSSGTYYNQNAANIKNLLNSYTRSICWIWHDCDWHAMFSEYNHILIIILISVLHLKGCLSLHFFYSLNEDGMCVSVSCSLLFVKMRF